MDVYDHFRVVARAVTNYSTYSDARNGRTISVPKLKAIVQQKLGDIPPELPSIEEALEEGARRSFWEMDLDYDFKTDIVVLR